MPHGILRVLCEHACGRFINGFIIFQLINEGCKNKFVLIHVSVSSPGNEASVEDSSNLSPSSGATSDVYVRSSFAACK